MDWLTPQLLQGTGLVSFALLVCGLIFRGVLVPKPFVDRSDTLNRERLADKDEQINHLRAASDQWRAAYDAEHAVAGELAEQNGRLIAQAEFSTRLLEAARNEVPRRNDTAPARPAALDGGN